MGKDLRYKFEHAGDYFVDMVSKVIDAGESAAKGVILTYDIKQLERQKENVLKKLGLQLAKNKRENTAIEQDERVKELMEQLDGLEQKLNICIEARNKKLYPTAGSCCTGNSEESNTVRDNVSENKTEQLSEKLSDQQAAQQA